jgi:hypothetical protein
VNPPRFVISVNNADHFHFSYLRYIENKIRDVFGFEGTPIDIELRSRKSIYKVDKNESGNDTNEDDPEIESSTKDKNKKRVTKKKYKK